jgi:peptidoglycan/LPS O-acetylase OafA/YrhL
MPAPLVHENNSSPLPACGVAALIVVMWHGFWFLGGQIPGGYLAVDFFFLLSGWVLAHAYDQRLATTMSPWGFFRARLIRLYPVYLLALALTFVGWTHDGNMPYATGLAALAFIPNFWDGPAFWLLAPSWSLTAEAAVNVPFGAFHRHLTDGVLAAVVVVALVGLIACGWFFGGFAVLSYSGIWPRVLSRALFSFPLGVLLYRHRQRLTRWAPGWATWPAMAPLLVVVIIPVTAQYESIRDLLTVALLFPALLLFASNAQPRPPTAAIANALGKMSYPLYLLHMAVFAFANVCLIAFAHISLGDAGPRLGLPLVALTVTLAYLIDRYFDRPVRRMLTGGRVARSVLSTKKTT